uniref:Uncharacterized protein n=1 Tax=Arundo donax TaxID=35708 RepID=A0A0A9D3B2_ARUDO
MQCIPTNEYAGSANLTWRSESLCFELILMVRLNTPLLLLKSRKELQLSASENVAGPGEGAHLPLLLGVLCALPPSMRRRSKLR